MRAPTTNWRRSLLALCVLALGCGVGLDAPPAAQVHQAVLGGTLDTTHREVVGVFVQPALSTGVGFCTGFLVAPNLVMTARHCVSDMDKSQLICADEVVQGTSYTAIRALAPAPASHFGVTEADDVVTTFPSMRGVSAVHVPPQSAGLPNCGNDVALLELSAPMAAVTPLALRDLLPVMTETFTAIGYGYDGAAANSDGVRRRRSGLGILAIGQVRGASGRIASTAQDWVATLGPCGGDSGAPAIDEQGKVIGVMSRGNPTVCQQMIYTQVTPFRDWVKQIARDAAGRAGIPLVDWVAAETAADAGSPDGGVLDAGVLDAGADAGEVDAGQADAGTPVVLPSLGVVSQPSGAGCNTTGAPLGVVGLAALGLLRSGAARRRRWLPGATNQREQSHQAEVGATAP